MDRSIVYQIRIRGHLGPLGAAWFEGLSLSPTLDGDTTIGGIPFDQSALHGVLARVRDLGLELVSVETVDIHRVPEPQEKV
jgi:hypothetical protein